MQNGLTRRQARPKEQDMRLSLPHDQGRSVSSLLDGLPSQFLPLVNAYGPTDTGCGLPIIQSKPQRLLSRAVPFRGRAA